MGMRTRLGLVKRTTNLGKAARITPSIAQTARHVKQKMDRKHNHSDGGVTMGAAATTPRPYETAVYRVATDRSDRSDPTDPSDQISSASHQTALSCLWLRACSFTGSK